MDDKTVKRLIQEAFEAQKNAYVPYSHFCVGAALLAKNGTIYRGCNIENAAFSPTNCAERTAFFQAVCEGVRAFDAIAIVGNKEGTAKGEGAFCAPCGVCRQVMREFCDPEQFRVILASSEERYRIYQLKELLPVSFSPEDFVQDGRNCHEDVRPD